MFVRELNWKPDVVIPIPLSRGRLAQRGYNQVGVIGRPLALALNLKYVPGALMRAKETRSQVGLTPVQRKENIQDAFRARVSVRGKCVLLLDDVATTTATLSSAARSLRQGGASRVLAVTVARALPRHGLESA
jgi:ComF family protein